MLIRKIFPLDVKLKMRRLINRSCGLLFVILFGCSLLPKTSSEPQKENHDMDLFLLIGQSNMAGRAPLNSSIEDTLENVFLFTGTGWEPAVNPFNKYSTVRKSLSMQSLGMGYSFVKEISRHTIRKIGLIVNARGGTALEWWQKDYEGKNDFDLYEEAVNQTKKAMEYGRLKGIIWHQGEANRKRYDSYLLLLNKMVEDLRQDLDNEAFFLLGEIGKWRSETSQINKVIRSVPDLIPNSDFVTSEDLRPRNDDATDPHFDTESQLVFGERYAVKVLEKVYGIVLSDEKKGF